MATIRWKIEESGTCNPDGKYSKTNFNRVAVLCKIDSSGRMLRYNDQNVTGSVKYLVLDDGSEGTLKEGIELSSEAIQYQKSDHSGCSCAVSRKRLIAAVICICVLILVIFIPIIYGNVI